MGSLLFGEVLLLAVPGPCKCVGDPRDPPMHDPSMNMGLGFRVGFRVWGLGFRVWGLEFGV